MAAPAPVPMKLVVALAAALLSLSAPPAAGSVGQVRVAAGALEPATGNDWFALGRSLYAERRYRESVAAFERGLQLGADGASEGAWNIARAYARLDNRTQALRWLAHARDLGYRVSRAARDDPAFGRYRDDPAFGDVVSPSACGRCRKPAHARHRPL